MILGRLKSVVRRATLYVQKLVSLAEMVGPQDHDLTPMVPSTLFVVEGSTLDIFAQRTTRHGRHLRRSVCGYFPPNNSTSSSTGRLTLSAPHSNGLGEVRIEGSNLSRRVSLRITSPVKTAKTRILCVGDSLSWQGSLSALNTKLLASGIKPEFVGTYREVGGLRSEARPSWQAANYTGQLAGVNSDGSGVTYPIDVERGDGHVTSTKEYVALADDPVVYGPRWQYNPFIRPATADDHASVVRGGFVFDMAFYLDRFDFEAPDIVFIALGTNDVRNQPAGASAVQIMDALDIIHAQTRRALPNAKIGIVLNGFGSSALWARVCPFIEQTLQQYPGTAASDTFTLPAYLVVDPVEGYKPTALDFQYQATHSAMKVDDTHMGEIGRQQWATLLHAFVVNNLVADKPEAPVCNSSDLALAGNP
jgi:lysophospholipase L1-like esterase